MDKDKVVAKVPGERTYVVDAGNGLVRFVDLDAGLAREKVQGASVFAHMELDPVERVSSEDLEQMDKLIGGAK